MMRTLKAGSRCRGQMLIAFAFGLVALLSAAGLVVDGGNLLIQRRTAQNAADAAALAGARALSVATSASDSTVATAICQYVTSNRAGQAPTAGASFVNSSGTTVGAIGLTSNCQSSQTATTIPATAAGVRVVATIGPFATFFLASAGIPTWTVSAAASSRVTQLASITPGAPIVAGCGGYMYDNTGGSYHGSLNIFVGSTP